MTDATSPRRVFNGVFAVPFATAAVMSMIVSAYKHMHSILLRRLPISVMRGAAFDCKSMIAPLTVDKVSCLLKSIREGLARTSPAARKTRKKDATRVANIFRDVKEGLLKVF